MADNQGQNSNALADVLLREALESDGREHGAEVEAIRRGLEACDEGRVRPFAEFAAEMRTKYHLPTHLSDEELIAPK